MKNCILTLLIFQYLLVSCQNKKDLYLLFKEVPEKVYINPSQKSLQGFDIFTYRVKIDKDYEEEIFFNTVTIEEERKYIDSNGKYKIKLHQRVIGLDKLKNYNVKDYKWLEKTIKDFTPFQALYQFYDKIYIVQKDSIYKKARLTEVVNVEIVE
ncbi:hypothetical protein [Lutibacter profundi]|nr:hypothetical protein [Lutibacter profundi]